MGIATMTRLYQLRQSQDQGVPETFQTTRIRAEDTRSPTVADNKPTATAQSADAAKVTALEKLTAFVPGEIVAAWLAVVSLLAPTLDWERWAIFAGALVLMVLLIVANAAAQQVGPAAPPATPPAPPIYRVVVISALAFTLWSFAAPGSPAVSFGADTPKLFAVLAIVITPMLYTLAKLWGVAPAAKK